MRFVVLGNCQGVELARVLRIAVLDDPSVDVEYIPSYIDARADDRTQSADIIFMQATDFKQVIDIESESTAKVVLYPLLECMFLWPTSTREHPLNRSSINALYPDGYYDRQLSCSFLNSLMRVSSDPQHISEFYNSADISAQIDLDRLFELNAVKMRRLEQRCQLDIWAQIEQNYKDVRLFFSTHHPSNVILKPMFKALFKKIGLDPVQIDRAMRSIESENHYKTMQMPVHPSVSEHFNLTWCGRDTKFQFRLEGDFSAFEYALRYARFSPTDDLRCGFEQFNAGNWPAAIQHLEDAARDGLDGGGVQNVIAIAKQQIGDVRGAIESAARSVELSPGRLDHLLRYGSLLRASGDFLGAQRILERGPNSDPWMNDPASRAACAYELGLCGIGLGRHTEGADMLAMSVRLAPDNDGYRRALARQEGSAPGRFRPRR